MIFYLKIVQCILVALYYGDNQSLFVIPDLNLPPGTEGNEVALNPQPSVPALYAEIESSEALQARNLQLAGSWERVQQIEGALENEGDPGRRQELSARLDQGVRELEQQILLGQRDDSIRDRQIAEWRRRLDAELSRVGAESDRLAFLNFCLQILIHAQNDQPPQN